ncbi:hypothetical protein TNCV_2257641 [Trichonephila clavipes]|nr:hypothetical protein TNCV_2257641 [Trichonephila clavipes]
MTHASGSKNLRSVTHDRSEDRFVEQNFVPDRKFTPSGDELFKFLRYLEASLFSKTEMEFSKPEMGV